MPTLTTNYLHNKTTQDIIQVLKNHSTPITASTIHREANITYATILDIIKTLARHKLITTEKKGRQLNITITTKGLRYHTLTTDINKLTEEQK